MEGNAHSAVHHWLTQSNETDEDTDTNVPPPLVVIPDLEDQQGDDGKDDRYNPDYKPKPTPRDELIKAMDGCDIVCSLGVGLQFILFGFHLFINMEQLHAWADGNLFLMSGTLWFIFISVWNVGVLLNYEGLMEMADWTRLVPFCLSIMGLSYYIVGIIAELVKMTSGGTW